MRADFLLLSGKFLRTRIRVTFPKVSTARNRLRPFTNFPASNPNASLTIAAMNDSLAIDNYFGWAGMALLCYSCPFSQTLMNLHPRSINAPVAEIRIHRLPVRKVSRQVAPSASLELRHKKLH